MFRSENTRNGTLPFDYGVLALQFMIALLIPVVLVELMAWASFARSPIQFVEVASLVCLTLYLGHFSLVRRSASN